MADTDTFVVRVYRRTAEGNVAHGVVEAVGREAAQPFSRPEELWDLMGSGMAATSQHPSRPNEGDKP